MIRLKMEKFEESTKIVQRSSKHKMAIDDASKFLKIVAIKEGCNQKVVSKVGIARKENIIRV